MKCQGWNHFTKECTQTLDKCGNCTGKHRTTNCSKSEIKCASCNSTEHASWSCKCPIFIKKMEEYNTQNPENTLHYFPTTKPWTWTASNDQMQNDNHFPPLPKPRYMDGHINNRHQNETWNIETYTPNPRRHTDTYIPNYTMTHTSRRQTQPTNKNLTPLTEEIQPITLTDTTNSNSATTQKSPSNNA